MQLSKRLEAVAAMVTPGSTLADIGTDHAYIPIWLAKTGRIAGAIAADVNIGPLQRAEKNIRSCGQERVIQTRRSDGLAAFRPGDADSIVIAGMGGSLTVRILKDGREVAAACRELILQPQSDVRQVRAYLEMEGWAIVQENLILEDGKFYPMMKAVRRMPGACLPESAEHDAFHEAELRYGPLLIRERSLVFLEFLKRECRINGQILRALEGQTGGAAEERRREVREELNLLRMAFDAASEKMT